MQVVLYNCGCKMVSWYFTRLVYLKYSEKMILQKVEDFVNSFPFPLWFQPVERMISFGNSSKHNQGYCFFRSIICYLVLRALWYGNIVALCNCKAKNKYTPNKWNHYRPLNWMSWHTKSIQAIIRRVSHSQFYYYLEFRNYFDCSCSKCEKWVWKIRQTDFINSKNSVNSYEPQNHMINLLLLIVGSRFFQVLKGKYLEIQWNIIHKLTKQYQLEVHFVAVLEFH